MVIGTTGHDPAEKADIVALTSKDSSRLGWEFFYWSEFTVLSHRNCSKGS